jgi:hypothetical protein
MGTRLHHRVKLLGGEDAKVEVGTRRNVSCGWETTHDLGGDIPGSQLYDGPEEEEQEGGGPEFRAFNLICLFRNLQTRRFDIGGSGGLRKSTQRELYFVVSIH